MKNYFWGDPGVFWSMVQAIGVIATLWFIWRQVRLQRIGNSIASLEGFRVTWDSDGMLSARAAVCAQFAADQPISGLQLERIAAFYETIGLYYQRGVFDYSMIWELYGYYVERYWWILEPEIKKLRHSDPTLYTEFEKLYLKIKAHSETRGAPNLQVQYGQLKAFAAEEVGKVTKK